MRRVLIPTAVFTLGLSLACSGVQRQVEVAPTEASLGPAPSAPAGSFKAASGRASMPWAQTVRGVGTGPYVVDLRTLPAAVPGQRWAPVEMPRAEFPVDEEQVERLRQEALLASPDPDIQRLTPAVGPQAPTPGVSFDSIDFSEGFDGTPPDPEMAAGPNHLIAVVNTSFEIYDKTGTTLLGATDFEVFFNPIPACAGVFDPNVIYDEMADRFIMGIDGGGDDYCVAVSQTADPTASWFLYSFPTDVSGAFFDYPHAGVGHDAIYMGSNQFTGSFLEARVWAFDKAAMYAGGAAGFVSQSTGFDSTPQPANFHGAADGTFPTSGPHWFITEVYDGCNHTVWSWTDPFGANSLVRGANLDLCAASGVTASFPINAPQLGGGVIGDITDWRTLDNAYRNGYLWTSQEIGCNPGGGTVDCVRWAQIDPVANTVVQAGVYASSGEYRLYPDVAVNSCNDMAIGYTKTSPSMWPSVWVTGRESGDPAGTVQPEIELKAGDQNYSCFDASPYRWGDYTGMTIDPDGHTFWYLGEYSKTISGSPACDWGNYIGSFTYPCALVFADGFESGDLSAWSGSVP